MNTYKIIFTRENGTQGTDHFTAINERQARKDFGECYRHSTATIISIELHQRHPPQQRSLRLHHPVHRQHRHRGLL